MLEPSGLYYSNRIARFFLLAMQEVLGRPGLDVLLVSSGLERYSSDLPPDNLSRQFDFAEMAALSQALEDAYGERGGRGMALRIGRAVVDAGLKSFGAMAGMSHPAFQRLPVEERAHISLQAFSEVFTTFSDQHTSIENDDTHYYVTVDASPMAWDRHAEKSVCHALTGVLQETLHWATGGHEFIVHETHCQASGDEHCIFKIGKSPIGKVG